MPIHSATLPTPTPAEPLVLVHGGAWAIPDDEEAAHERGLREALAVAGRALSSGAAAFVAASAAVAHLEQTGTFDAGSGAVLTNEGTVELDAGIMDGATLRWGAVACVSRLAQPIRVAAHLLVHSDGQARLLVGEGAERYAERAGFGLVGNAALRHTREVARYEALREMAERAEAAVQHHTSHAFLVQPDVSPRGTVGCVVRDGAGRVASATSTGGTPHRPPGRVGDSPLVGSGFYADDLGAASATGWGEAIATVQLAGRAVRDTAVPESAARRHLAHMGEAIRNPEGATATAGLLLVRTDGSAAWAFSTPKMARAWWTPGHDVFARVAP